MSVCSTLVCPFLQASLQMHVRLISSLSVVLLLAVVCCSPKMENPSHTFHVINEDGVPTAISSAEPKYDKPLFEYEVVLTLDSDPNRPESLMSNPRRFMMSEDVHFYVMDRRELRIVVFSPQGDYLRSFGGQGEGPGEFVVARMLGLWDGVLNVWDSNLQRTSRFRTDGSLIEMVSYPLGGRPSEVYRGPDELLLVTRGIRSTESEYEISKKSLTVVGSSQDTLAVIETPPVLMTKRLSRGDLRVGFRLPFTMEPYVAYIPGTGILTSAGQEPELHWYDLTGSLARRIRIDLPPEGPTVEDKRVLSEALDEQIVEAEGRQRDMLEIVKAGREYPEVKAPWGGIMVDSGGYHWLRYSQSWSDIEADGGILFRLVSPEGEYLGDTRMPPNRSVVMNEAVIANGKLLCVVEDPESGERIPTVYDIQSLVPGFRYP